MAKFLGVFGDPEDENGPWQITMTLKQPSAQPSNESATREPRADEAEPKTEPGGNR